MKVGRKAPALCKEGIPSVHLLKREKKTMKKQVLTLLVVAAAISLFWSIPVDAGGTCTWTVYCVDSLGFVRPDTCCDWNPTATTCSLFVYRLSDGTFIKRTGCSLSPQVQLDCPGSTSRGVSMSVQLNNIDFPTADKRFQFKYMTYGGGIGLFLGVGSSANILTCLYLNLLFQCHFNQLWN